MSKIIKDTEFNPDADLVLYPGDCLDLLSQIPNNFVKLVVTSPPYNLGKDYENKLDMEEYVSQQRDVIKECVRILDDDGSICWQVGNYVNNGEIIPLDIALYPIFESLNLHLRNRVVWHFSQYNFLRSLRSFSHSKPLSVSKKSLKPLKYFSISICIPSFL